MMNALMGAAHGGHLAILELLLNRGASPYMRDDHGVSALDYAIREDNVEIVISLVQHVSSVRYHSGSSKAHTGWGVRKQWCRDYASLTIPPWCLTRIACVCRPDPN